MSIGIFDSGFGGLTVMRAIQDLLPTQHCIYFGDTARLPYGNRSPETIRRFCVESTAFLIHQNIKLLVIACNTACSCAFEEIQKGCSIPVVGVITPGVAQISSLLDVKKVAILGTRATIASGVHRTLLARQLVGVEIQEISCPLFVPLVEEGYVDHPLTRVVIHEYLRPILDSQADTVLLACTHYPLLAQALARELGDSVRLIDPGKACAQEVARLLNNSPSTHDPRGLPDQFFVSDDPEKFRLLGAQFLMRPIEQVSTNYW